MSSFDDSRTTVLFLDTTPFFGPLMQVHSRVMKHLDRSRYRVVLAGIESGDYEAFRAEVPDVKIVRYGSQSGRRRGLAGRVLERLRPIVAAWRYVRLGMLARRERAKVVHVGMTVNMLVAGNIVSLISGARLVVHVHGDPLRPARWKRMVYRAGMQRAAAVIGVSTFIKGRLVRLGTRADRTHPVLNTVDLNRFNPNNDGSSIREEYGIPQDAPLVLCLGRLFPRKGQHYLLRSMAKISEGFGDAHTLIVGWEDSRSGGRFQDLLHSIIRENGLDNRAIVAPARPGAPLMMAAADIVAAPSTEDPCPLTVLEAMATGKPVVGFRSGGIPEELGDDDGVLVEVGDEHALADALRKLLADPQLRASIGERNRRRAEVSHYESRLALDVAEIYESILGARPAIAASAHDASPHDASVPR